MQALKNFWGAINWFSKLLISCALVAVIVFVLVQLDVINIPEAKIKQAVVPQRATLPTGQDPVASSARSIPEFPLPTAVADYLSTPSFKVLIWAWNSQMGLMYSMGGTSPMKGSLMAQQGVNLLLERQDDAEKMKLEQLTFAQALKDGNPYPNTGAAFVSIMGDAAGQYIASANKNLIKLGPEYCLEIVGSCGYSRGEDKVMGPEIWKKNPQSMRGCVIAAYLRDGDWNIVQKLAGDNGIPNNPDETTYDPNAINWVAANDYKDAALKYVQGYEEDRPEVINGKPTGRTVHIKVQGVATWTPGDVIVARERGGLVSIVSTKEYSYQMPNNLIGVKKWNADNKETVARMLAAIADGGEQVKTYPRALRYAAEVSNLVYNEAGTDPAYWEKYYRGVIETDVQGLRVELGGSKVNNLADMYHLFGLNGGTNICAATYKVFGDIVVQQYPNLVPNYPPFNEVFNPQYLRLAQSYVKTNSKAEVPSFAGASTSLSSVVSRRSYTIEFNTGSADFKSSAYATLDSIYNNLIVAGDLVVVVHGHTDITGTPDGNLILSDRRAKAFKNWAESKDPTNFPAGRIQTVAHGQNDPIDPGTTPESFARNRRIEIVLGRPNTIN